MRRIQEDLAIQVGGFHFVVPELEFEQCPDCGEQIFDLAAMEKINAHRPAMARDKTRRAIA